MSYRANAEIEVDDELWRHFDSVGLEYVKNERCYNTIQYNAESDEQMCLQEFRDCQVEQTCGSLSDFVSHLILVRDFHDIWVEDCLSALCHECDSWETGIVMVILEGSAHFVQWVVGALDFLFEL